MDRSGDLVIEDFSNNPEEAIDNIHLMVISLQHLYCCLTLLTSAGVAIDGSRRFRREWDRISGLRDALEHEEEYIAGQNQKPGLVGTGWRETGFEIAPSVVVDDEGIVDISAMLKSYRVRLTINAVGPLEVPLRRLFELS